MGKKAEIKKTVKQQKSEKELAQAKLLELDQKDVDNCSKEIEASLNKHGCVLIPKGQFAGNQMKSGVAIVKRK